MLQRVRGGHAATELESLWRPPGHYYSPIPDPREVEADKARLWPRDRADSIPGVDLRVDHQVALLQELARFHDDFPPYGPDPLDGYRFRTENRMYGLGDAGLLHAFLRHEQPRRVVEVGSGFSSAVMLDTAEHFLADPPSLTFIEPYPQRLEALLRDDDRASTTIIRKRAQDVPLSVFSELEAHDILVIDSSHVAKTGSDVVHLYGNVLPRLQPGALVHVHDIGFPFEYPQRWVMEGRAWNEAYVLNAFLAFNDAFRIELWNSCLGALRPPSVYDACPRFRGGSQIWIRRVA